MKLLHKRPDGSFVADIDGRPYHVVEGDERFWESALEAAREVGAALQFEPPPPEAPEVVAPVISDRQFAQGLAIAGLITEAEAEEWVGPGVVPATLLAFVAELPESDQFSARMILRGATQFERSHPLTEAFGAKIGWKPEHIDQFWLRCSEL